MTHRLLGLCAGLLCLGAAAACGGSSDDPETPTGAADVAPEADATGATAPNSTGPADVPTPVRDPEETIAVVNDEEIKRGEYEEQLTMLQDSYTQQGQPFPAGEELAQLKQQLMQQLVQQKLVLQETVTRDIQATPEEVQARYQETLAGFPDEAALNQALEAEGLTREDLDRLLSENVKIDKLLDSVVQEAALPPPTEEELRALYDQTAQQQQLPPFEEVRTELEAAVNDQKQTDVILAFVQELESRSDVQIVGEL